VASRAAKAVAGTTTWSSSLPVREVPASSRTPITVNSLPATLTGRPIGEPIGNSSPAVVAPRTATGAPASTSSEVKNRPSVTLRARTASQSGTVPTTSEVQVDSVDCSGARVVATGATATTSGTTDGSASTAASAGVSEDVVAAPRKPANPLVEPGLTMIRLEPRELICWVIAAWAPWPSPTVSITAAIPIRMPSMVSAERSRRAFSASKAVRAVSAHPITASLPPAR